MGWTCAWGGAGNEAVMRVLEVGSGQTVSVVVCTIVYGSEFGAVAAPGVEGDLVGTLMGREDGFVSVRDGMLSGGESGEVSWFGEVGVESSRDCAG